MTKEINLVELEKALLTLDINTFTSIVTKCHNVMIEKVKKNYTKGQKLNFKVKEGEKEITKEGFILYVNEKSLTLQALEQGKMVMFNLGYLSTYATVSKK